MTITGSWIMSPERAIQTEAGPFIVAYHGDNRATVRSDPYEINHRLAPAGDIHLKQGTFRAVSAELTRENGVWTVHRLSGYRIDRPTMDLAADISPLFAKAWAQLVLPFVLEQLDDEAFIVEGENAMISRNLAHLSSAIDRQRETMEKARVELESLTAARAGIIRSLTEEQLAALTGVA